MTTIGEYVKTGAAQAEVDSKIRKNINDSIKFGYKLIKYHKGKKGTLDYGRAVMMYIRESDVDFKKLFPKVKPMIIIHRVDYGILTYASKDGSVMEQKLFRQKAAAEKQYQSWVRWTT